MKALKTFLYSTRSADYFDHQSSQDQYLVQVPAQGRAESQVKPPDPDNTPGGLLTVLGFSTFALIFFAIKRFQASEKVKDGLGSAPNLLYSTPCSKCRFFNKNPYLKCTVHPQMASKIDAKNCTDFWPVDQDEFHKKW
ncbi:hypothetical protein C7271_25875 [filamentous cyanobacterium CCP5]|nr:hypothetical protein C7271_25875 [filamentous cyanobacterium CCP5]PSN13500.1 hypothetical protein C7293_15700 [filamentous cyanobacterium CCT1]PSN80345.1 hypothetical protein C8B47_07065 [filamentous cyanobacterium CCP4]